MSPPKVDHSNTKCCRCGNSKSNLKFVDSVGKEIYHWYKHIVNNRWDGKYCCASCYNKTRTDRRTGKLDINSNNAKGDHFEDLKSLWRGVKRLNIENDNFTGISIDHSKDSELGILQTKGRFYNLKNRNWCFVFEREWFKEFDHEICYCASKDGKIIERIYIFPGWDMLNISGVTIFKYDSKGNLYEYGWYEKYRIKDEETIKKVNEMWKKILNSNRV